MIKVLHTHLGWHPLPHEGQGCDTCVLETVKSVSRVPGYSATLVDFRSPAHAPLRGAVEVIEVFNPGILGNAFAAHVLRSLSYALSSAFVAVRNARRFAIVHCHNQVAAALIIALKCLFRLPFKVVYTLYNVGILEPEKYHWIYWFLEPYVLRHADHVIALTPAVRKFIVGKMGVPAERVTQIYLGIIDMDRARSAAALAAAQSSGPVIVYVACISERKNQRALIKALPAVVRQIPSTRCIFIGSCPEPAYLEELRVLARQEGVEDRLEYAGIMGREQMYGVLSRARVSAVLSTSETQGLMLIEAMACGLPVVASPIEPFVDVISREPGSALLVDPEDTEAVAAALKRMLTDDALYAAMRRSSLALAERFSWDAIAPVLVDTYRKVLK